MKQKTIFILFFIFCVNTYAKTAQIPDWVHNYHSVYPDTEYLVQRGSGRSAEEAKTDAIAALSRYFKTNVIANLSTTMNSVVSDDYVDETTIVINDITVQSQVDLFGLEFTDPYYLKAEKKWYCVVYINRHNAWLQYKPQIEIKKNTFEGLYKQIENEPDYFLKLQLCKKIWNYGKELIELLEYARIISPIEESAYKPQRERFSTIPVIFEESKRNCSIYIQLNKDYNRSVESTLSIVLNECGFEISKTDINANYIANIFLSDNITGENPLAITPSINLKINNKLNKTVYSSEIIVKEKTIGYTLESAQRKAYPKLTKELEETIKQNLYSFFSL